MELLSPVWTPFSYGSLITPAHDWVGYLPLALLGLGGLGVVAWARRPGSSLLRPERRGIWLVAALLTAAALLGLPASRGALLQLATGGYQVLVDLRGFDATAALPALSRSSGGGLVYFGHLKKSLLQSCPYLVLLVLPMVALYRRPEERGPLAALLLVPATFVTVFSFFTWEFGGMVLHQRYLAPILPFTSILTAHALRTLFRASERPTRTAAWTVGWATCAAYYALVRWRGGSVDTAEWVYLTLPLLMAALLLGLSIGIVLRGPAADARLTAATRLLAVGALVWAGLVALLYDYDGSRWLRGYNAELSRRAADVVAPDSILFTTHPDPFCGLFEVDRVRLALPPRDGFRDFRPLVDFHLQHGRAVYAAFPEDLWGRIERRQRLQGLRVERLWEHPVFVMGRIVPAH